MLFDLNFSYSNLAAHQQKTKEREIEQTADFN